MKLIGQNQLTWKPHIRYIKNKIIKNTGLLFKAKHFEINNAFCRYTIHVSIAALTMPTWLGEVHA